MCRVGGHHERSSVHRAQALASQALSHSLGAGDFALLAAYLAYALILNAGLSGIENEMVLPDPAEDDVWSLTDRQREALGIKPLPHSLDAAVRAMETSQLVADTLGEHVFDFVLRNKRAEYAEYMRQVTPLELSKLLPSL